MILLSKSNNKGISMLRNNLFVIIEGPDNVGKSTLIQGLKNHFNDYTLHSLHYSNVKQDNADDVVKYSTLLYSEMFEMMCNFSNSFQRSGIICDRAHLGEMVYGPIYRNYTGEYVLEIENSYKNHSPIWNDLFLITLIDEPENLIARDDGLSFTVDTVKKENEINSFINAHNKSNITNKLLLNIDSHDQHQALNAVVEFIEGVE